MTCKGRRRRKDNGELLKMCPMIRNDFLPATSRVIERLMIKAKDSNSCPQKMKEKMTR